MKKKWVFLIGMLTGILLMIILILANRYLPDMLREKTVETLRVNRDSIRLAIEEERIMLERIRYSVNTFEEKSVKVFQVIQSVNNNEALVCGKNEYGYYSGMLYLLEADKFTALYDGQIIKIPKGRVLRMIGTYQYVTTDGGYNTVPKVKITDK